MSGDIFININFWKKRWVAYLDLLGSSDMVENDPWTAVFIRYSKAIEIFGDCGDTEGKIGKDRFSDSFILYSEDDSKESFKRIHSCTHNFVMGLLLDGIPARGAIACDEFYADKDNRLYFGKALNDAHELGECINFITYMLTLSATQRMNEIGLPIEERLNYAYYKVPYKNSYKKEKRPEKLPAYIVGSSCEINGRPFGIDELRGLMPRDESSGDISTVKQKYQNTLDFAEKHLKHRRIIPAQ